MAVRQIFISTILIVVFASHLSNGLNKNDVRRLMTMMESRDLNLNVNLEQDVLNEYQDLKKGKYRFLILKYAPKNKIIVEQTCGADCTAEDIRDFLPENDCRFVLFNLNPKLLSNDPPIKLIAWIPEEAPVRSKMLYASSQQAVRQSFDVTTKPIQIDRLDEITDNLLS